MVQSPAFAQCFLAVFFAGGGQHLGRSGACWQVIQVFPKCAVSNGVDVANGRGQITSVFRNGHGPQEVKSRQVNDGDIKELLVVEAGHLVHDPIGLDPVSSVICGVELKQVIDVVAKGQLRIQVVVLSEVVPEGRTAVVEQAVPIHSKIALR